MAEITIDFPMTESVAIAVGDKLTITFTEDCHPCWAPDDQGLFDHPLPHHDHHKGYQWTGTAVKNGIIECSHVAHGEKCVKKHHHLEAGGRTISVGD